MYAGKTAGYAGSPATTQADHAAEAAVHPYLEAAGTLVAPAMGGPVSSGRRFVSNNNLIRDSPSNICMRDSSAHGQVAPDAATLERMKSQHLGCVSN